MAVYTIMAGLATLLAITALYYGAGAIQRLPHLLSSVLGTRTVAPEQVSPFELIHGLRPHNKTADPATVPQIHPIPSSYHHPHKAAAGASVVDMPTCLSGAYHL